MLTRFPWYFLAAESKATSAKDDLTMILDEFNTYVEAWQNLLYVIGLIAIVLLIFLSLFSVQKRSHRFTNKQIEALKQNRKYIPDVFSELNNSKEVLRYFVYGKKWKKRVINYYNFIYSNYYGEILRSACETHNVNFHLSRFANEDEIENAIDKALEFHKQIKEGQTHFKEGYTDSEPLFRYNYTPYENLLKRIQPFAKAANSNYVVLTGSAGNGKTNMLCSIAELLIKLKNPVILLSARDIEGHVEDTLLNSINVADFWKKHSAIYFWCVNLLLWLKRKHLFIFVDAINENDRPGFGQSVNSFVNSFLRYTRFKILVSCRNEYFESRFSKPLSEDVDKKHLVYDIKEVSYSKEAVDRLIKRYSDYYNFTGYISEAVKATIQEHLLLLRIFFEVYQHSDSSILSVCKHELFAEYIRRIKVNTLPQVEKLIDLLADKMLQANNYDYIELDELTGLSVEKLEKAYDETVLVSKKIVSHVGTIACTEKEVIYFVFDELRDYCIARRLMQTNVTEDSVDGDRIIQIIENIKDKKASCEEGVLQYTYVFFKTSEVIEEESKKQYCLRLLDSYKIGPEHQPNYWHMHHREEYINFGIKIILSSGLPIEDYEITYIRDCLRKAPDEDGGKIFDSMLHGTIVGSPLDLKFYLEILFGFSEGDEIVSVLQSIYGHSSVANVDLPNDLAKYHQELFEQYPDRAKQIQNVAELLLIVFVPNERTMAMKEYFTSLSDHHNVHEEILNRLLSAIRKES